MQPAHSVGCARHGVVQLEHARAPRSGQTSSPQTRLSRGGTIDLVSMNVVQMQKLLIWFSTAGVEKHICTIPRGWVTSHSCRVKDASCSRSPNESRGGTLTPPVPMSPCGCGRLDDTGVEVADGTPSTSVCVCVCVCELGLSDHEGGPTIPSKQKILQKQAHLPVARDGDPNGSTVSLTSSGTSNVPLRMSLPRDTL